MAAKAERIAPPAVLVSPALSLLSCLSTHKDREESRQSASAERDSPSSTEREQGEGAGMKPGKAASESPFL